MTSQPARGAISPACPSPSMPRGLESTRAKQDWLCLPPGQLSVTSEQGAKGESNSCPLRAQHARPLSGGFSLGPGGTSGAASGPRPRPQMEGTLGCVRVCLPLLMRCFSPDRMPGVSMMLMLSRTGLGSWAHMNLQGSQSQRGHVKTQLSRL